MRASALVAIALLLSAGVAAAATPTPRKPIARYCSSSGDVCFGVVNRSGAVYLELRTAARYFARYRLCIRKGTRAWRCRGYPLRRTGSIWASSVKFARHFPNAGPGAYRVRWSLGTRPLGPVLRFRLPL